MRALTIVLLLLAAATPAAQAISPSPAGIVDGLQGDAGERAITYVGVWRDRPDLHALPLGTAGSWFPQFAPAKPVAGAATADGARDELPSWVAAFNHTTGPADPGCREPGAIERGCTPTYSFRTFSQDGPARSAGGFAAWSRLRLPSGECGTSGAIVDPQTFIADQEHDDPTGLVSPRTGEPKPNNNNTINRIQLQDSVPSTFFVAVVTDNTAGQHDVSRLEIRGNIGVLDVPSDRPGDAPDSQIEPTFPTPIDLVSNGVPDVHVFRVDGFVTGDYLKLRLRGATSPGSFGGLLFDTADDADPDGRGRGRGHGAGRPAGGMPKRSCR